MRLELPEEEKEVSPTRRVRFWLSARWRRRRILAVKPQLRMSALKNTSKAEARKRKLDEETSDLP